MLSQIEMKTAFECVPAPESYPRVNETQSFPLKNYTYYTSKLKDVNRFTMYKPFGIRIDDLVDTYIYSINHSTRQMIGFPIVGIRQRYV